MELSSIDIKVMYCKDLKGFNFFQKLSVYAVVSITSDDPDKKLEQKQQHRTPTDKEGDGNPEWNHEMRFDLKGVSFQDCDHLFIHFELKHEGVMFGNKNIGEVRVPCKNLIQESDGGFKFVNYEVRSTDGKPNGVLCFSYKVNGKTTALGTNSLVSEVPGFVAAHHPQTLEAQYPQLDVHSSTPVHSVHPQTSEILYPPISVHSSTPEVQPQTSEILYPPLDVHSSTPEFHPQTSEILYPPLDVHSSPPKVHYPIHSSTSTQQDVQYLSPISQHPHKECYYPTPDTYYPRPAPPPPVFAHPHLPPLPPPPPPPPMPHGAFYHPPPTHFHAWAPEPHMASYGPSTGHLPAFENGVASPNHFTAWRDRH